MSKHGHESPRCETMRLLRIPEVAEALAVSSRSVWRLIAAGDLPVVRIGRSARVTAEAVDALIAKGGR
jgi:excisionase family DNA binding protein